MLTIILKGTNGCNLVCSYCSLGKKVNMQFADENRLLQIFRYACEVCKYRNEKKLTFILHGGEPTLIQASVYSRAIDRIQKEYPQIHMRFSIQTNAVYIKDEILKFISKYDINVGVSIDGSETIHDAERKTITNQPTFKLVSNNILKMIHSGIHVSCLMVLTSNALKENYEYLKFFEHWDLPLKINPLLNYGEVYEHPELSLKSGEYAKYLIQMYQYIIENNINVCVSPIDKILRGILFNEGMIQECSFNAMCNKNFFCVDYKGDIYPCGKYSDLDQFRIGNIDERNYDIMNSPIIIKLINRRSYNLPEKCKICKYQKLCNAGCNAEASIYGDIEKEPFLCEDYKRLFSFFYKDGLLLFKKNLLKQKQQRS